jgi:hypothetical protein
METFNPLLELPRLNVQSTNIKSIGYDSEKRILVVEFTNQSHIYSYEPITEQAYQEFINAPSKGQYFKQHIRDNPAVTCKCIQGKKSQS